MQNVKAQSEKNVAIVLAEVETQILNFQDPGILKILKMCDLFKGSNFYQNDEIIMLKF